MLKKLKIILFIAICILFLPWTRVEAEAIIDSKTSLQEVFKDKNVKITDSTVTLTGDVKIEDKIKITSGNYTIDLNKFNFQVEEIEIQDSALNIKGNNKKGTIITEIINCYNSELVFEQVTVQDINSFETGANESVFINSTETDVELLNSNVKGDLSLYISNGVVKNCTLNILRIEEESACTVERK